MPVGPNGFDKLDESAAGLRDPMLWPGRVVEMMDHHIVPMLHAHTHTNGRRSREEEAVAISSRGREIDF